MSKHSLGPWELGEDGDCIWSAKDSHGFQHLVATIPFDNASVRKHDGVLACAAPELLEALEDAVDLAWIEDSHVIQFDSSVMFGPHYDFSGLDGPRRIEFYGMYSCIVWPGEKWSAYCTYEGTTWLEKFDTSGQAKEACMKLLDKVLPHHPAMRARAAIAKATGGDV